MNPGTTLSESQTPDTQRSGSGNTGEEVLVNVTKGQTTLIFSSHGGVLKHVEMNQYTNLEGDGPIDLIPAGRRRQISR